MAHSKEIHRNAPNVFPGKTTPARYPPDVLYIGTERTDSPLVHTAGADENTFQAKCPLAVRETEQGAPTTYCMYTFNFHNAKSTMHKQTFL